jgi:hypothetical protein
MLLVAAHGEHRVHEQVGGHALALEHHSYGVDEERSVTGDDQGDRSVGVPTIAVTVRSDHRGDRLAGLQHAP